MADQFIDLATFFSGTCCIKSIGLGHTTHSRALSAPDHP